MRFMKRTYYFDPDYLFFIKEFVYMYNFDWKLKISNEISESKALQQLWEFALEMEKFLNSDKEFN